MKVTIKQYARILLDISDNGDSAIIQSKLKNFFSILQKNKDASKIKQIVKEFVILWNEKNNIVDLKIITAKKIESEIMQDVLNILQEKFFGKKISMQNVVDEKIIGGLIIKNQDKIMDLSIQKQLKEILL